MIVGSAARLAGNPAGKLCMSTTGCCWLPPASAREMMRSTQDAEVEEPAFQSSVSTDQFQTAMRRCWARARVVEVYAPCLLYTSDAADEEDSVDLGGRRIIKKK